MHPRSTVEHSHLQAKFIENGFATLPFPQELRILLLAHIDEHIREFGFLFFKPGLLPTATLEQITMSVPDAVWSKKMARAFRIFPKTLSEKIHQWADRFVRMQFGRKRSVINVILAHEAELNPKISKDHLAIYWRCVRPGKPDAGRPHRDATFWEIELAIGYDPKIPFPFDFRKDCIKIWIPLKGCTPQTALQVIPRSHRMELDTVVEETEYGARPNIDPDWLQKHEQDFVSPAELSEGACILFDMNLVHRGPAHNNTELRLSAELNLIVQ